MFDTNIFNAILDGQVELDPFLKKYRLYATHVQRNEILRTSNEDRRAKLIGVFNELIAPETSISTESFVLGASNLNEAKLKGEEVPPKTSLWGKFPWGKAPWGASGGLYGSLKKELDQLNRSKPNNINDALIGETAIVNRCTLATHDRHLTVVVNKFGGKTCRLEDLMK